MSSVLTTTTRGTQTSDSHDTADQLDHTVSDGAQGPNGKNLQHPVNLEVRVYGITQITYGIRIPVTITNLVILSSGPGLPT